MGLEHNEDKYNRIIVCHFSFSILCRLITAMTHQKKLKNLKREAGFKDGVLFSGQSKEKIVRYCRLVRFPISSTSLSSTALMNHRQENRSPTFVDLTETG
jgi:hypothetical protein